MIKSDGILNIIIKDFHADAENDLFEYSDDGASVYYNETLESISKEIVNTYSPPKMRRIFGRLFEEWQECYAWLRDHLPELQDYISERYELLTQ